MQQESDRRRFLKHAVAALPRTAIAEMQRRELIFAIRTAELPWLNGAPDLEFADRPTLERLAYLARRVCRRQLNGSFSRSAPNGEGPWGQGGWDRAFLELPVPSPAAMDALQWREKPR